MVVMAYRIFMAVGPFFVLLLLLLLFCCLLCFLPCGGVRSYDFFFFSAFKIERHAPSARERAECLPSSCRESRTPLIVAGKRCPTWMLGMLDTCKSDKRFGAVDLDLRQVVGGVNDTSTEYDEHEQMGSGELLSELSQYTPT